jgi:hypothetical protein
LSRSIANPKVLSEVAAGEWLLGANLEVLGGAALEVSAPTARWLKLSSNPNGFASLKAIGGRIDITGACVTSWDAGQNSADTEYDTGRSFLLARDGAQTVIDRAELRYLGFGNVESSGVSWRTAGTGTRGVGVALGLGRASALLEHSVVYPTSKPGPQLVRRRLDVVDRQMMLLLHHLWEVEAQPARVLLGQRGDDQPGVARVLPKLLVDGVDG